jgi:hypothetical protein
MAQNIDDTLLEDIQELYDAGKNPFYKSFLGKKLIELTPFLTKKGFPRQRMWHILNNIDYVITCKMCTNLVKWDDAVKNNKEQKYRTYCSHKCLHNDPEQQAKKRKTEIERYGIGKKSIVEKIKSTNNKRYGADFAIQTIEFQEKQKETNIERYGVENVIQKFEILEKREKTTNSRFGTMYVSQQHLDPKILKLLEDKNWIETEHVINKKSIAQLARELDCNYEIITRKLNRFNIPIQYYPSTSTHETDLLEIIKTQYPTIKYERNNRTIIAPKEIDFYFPDYKLGIELNGIYWHSELRGRNEKYHFNKLVECKVQNIKLLQFWDYEWLLKQDIILSKLRILFGKADKIYARNTKVKMLTAAESKEFYQINHLQGSCHSLVHIGLMHNDTIVSIMSFGKSRFNKNFEYELTRFCSLQNTTIVGGASKLMTYFIKNYNPQSIISYCDLRFGNGKFYEKLQFTKSHRSNPNYFYFKPGSLDIYSRQKFQKHKLKGLLPIFDEDLTEWENMQVNGYDRIWDCGNDVWIWKK